ncbi:MAG: FkbM family methyltransferase [Acidobacteria bacterium]|nr:MAG: FkbM family methyltransferase [Acidobacteriota bacterium]
MIRQILKRLSRGVILKRRLPIEFGKTAFLVSPESALGYWRHNIARVDPFLLSMARQWARNETTVWDIGANVGLFSFAAAALGSRVLAVEADVWLASLLHRSVLLNGAPVTVLAAAVAATPGISSLHFSEEGKSSNSLLGAGPAQTVVTITLDWILEHYPPPQVLKIDVEGMEYRVLKGAHKVLEHRPVILCEVTQDHDGVGQLLRNAGYVLYAARDQRHLPLQRPSRDTLALPSLA